MAFSAVARMETLQTLVPSLHVVVLLWPVTRTIWDGLASAFALGLFMSLLPSWLTFICDWLFVMKSGRQLQLQVQTWYFWFLVVFVLMVTAIGSSLFYTITRLAQRPGEIFSLLATTLPYATHFYLSYFPLQWSVYALEATRSHVALRYLALRVLWGSQRAVEACQPEDQAMLGCVRLAPLGVSFEELWHRGALCAHGAAAGHGAPFLQPLTAHLRAGLHLLLHLPGDLLPRSRRGVGSWKVPP